MFNEQVIKQMMEEYVQFCKKLTNECMDSSGVFDYESYNTKMRQWIIEGIESDIKKNKHNITNDLIT